MKKTTTLPAQFRRQILTPYWVPDPFIWRTEDSAGISYFATEGWPGMFNLAWLFLNQSTPPNAEVYRQYRAEMAWVIQAARVVRLREQPIEWEAAMKTLPDFMSVLTARVAGYSPYLTTLRLNGLERLQHDPRRSRTTR